MHSGSCNSKHRMMSLGMWSTPSNGTKAYTDDVISQNARSFSIAL